jgi:hypothetical protein
MSLGSCRCRCGRAGHAGDICDGTADYVFTIAIAGKSTARDLAVCTACAQALVAASDERSRRAQTRFRRLFPVVSACIVVMTICTVLGATFHGVASLTLVCVAAAAAIAGMAMVGADSWFVTRQTPIVDIIAARSIPERE